MSNQRRFALLKQHEIGTDAWNEAAQDAIGAILTDSSEIDFTYTQSGPTITASLINASITFAKLQNADALSVVGRAANSSGVLDEIAAGANDRILRRTSDTLNWGQLTAGMFPNTVVPDAALSSNVALLNRSPQSYTGTQVIGPSSARLLITSDGSISALSLGDRGTISFQVLGTTSATSSLGAVRFNTGTSGGALILGHAKVNTVGSFTILQDNDQLGEIQFVAADGADLVTLGAYIRAQVNGTPGADDMPTELIFATTAAGAASPTVRIVISPTGQITTQNSAGFVIGGTGETLATFVDDGAVTLYFDNSAKIATKSDGVNVTGELECDALDVDGEADFSAAIQQTGIITPTTLSADTNNWNPTGLSTCNVIRATTDASRNLTGLAAQSGGREITLFNAGVNPLVLVHDSASSTDVNRFALVGAVLTIPQNGCAVLWYDGTTQRWRVKAHNIT